MAIIMKRIYKDKVERNAALDEFLFAILETESLSEDINVGIASDDDECSFTIAIGKDCINPANDVFIEEHCSRHVNGPRRWDKTKTIADVDLEEQWPYCSANYDYDWLPDYEFDDNQIYVGHIQKLVDNCMNDAIDIETVKSRHAIDMTDKSTTIYKVDKVTVYKYTGNVSFGYNQMFGHDAIFVTLKLDHLNLIGGINEVFDRFGPKFIEKFKSLISGDNNSIDYRCTCYFLISQFSHYENNNVYLDIIRIDEAE